jgi:hypothetical protein
MRELGNKHGELLSLIHEVQQEFYLGDYSSIVQAYRTVLKNRENPPSQEQFEEEFRRKKGSSKSRDKNNIFDEMDAEFEDFLRQFAEQQEAKFQEQELRQHERNFKAPPLNQRLKDLYRKLVRKLHPDTSEAQSAQRLEWWHQVQDAYEREDIEQLEVILTLCEAEESGLSKNTPISILFRITTQFKSALRAMRKELRAMQSDPAWKFSEKQDLGSLEVELRDAMEQDCARLREGITECRAIIESWEALARRTPAARKRARSRSVMVEQELF